LDGNEPELFIASIIDHKLVEWGQMRREVSLQFLHRRPTYLRAIKSEEINPALSVNIILEDVRIEQSDNGTQYLAIARQAIWMLCDIRIVPIKGQSNPGCWDIMIQAHLVIATQDNSPRRNPLQ
jgi:hypothetical protein